MAGEPKPWSADRTLGALLDALGEGVLVFDAGQVCRAAGRGVGELCGIDPCSLVGLHREEVLLRVSASLDEPDQLLAPLSFGVISDESTTVDPIHLIRPCARLLVWTSVPIEEGAGAVGRLDILRDVTRERGAELASEAMARKLSAMATVDELTGLANRRRFEQETDREHRRAQRAWDSYAVLRIHVGGLAHTLEAQAGAAEGELLRRLGEELRSARREYDLVARWDDDEFIVLLPGASATSARVVARRSVAGMKEKAPAEEAELILAAGAAVWIPPSGETAADIIRRAGEALALARGRAPGAVEIDAGFAHWNDERSEES